MSVPYRIRRSDRARRIRVSVDGNGEIEVVLPRRSPERHAAEAVKELAPWIERRRRAVARVALEVARTPGTVPYLGETLRLVLESSLARNPHQPDVHLHLAMACGHLGRFAEAHQHFDRAEQLAPSGGMSLYYGWYRSSILGFEGRFPEAVANDARGTVRAENGSGIGLGAASAPRSSSSSGTSVIGWPHRVHWDPCSRCNRAGTDLGLAHGIHSIAPGQSRMTK